MHNKFIFVMALATTSLITSCSTMQLTPMRRANASMSDQRRDWGLCGGNFLPNGMVRPDYGASVIACMRSKGYQTLNDYYVEQHVDFSNINDRYVYAPKDVLRQCGVQYVADTLCSNQGYVMRSRLPQVSSCMQRKGYSLSLPQSFVDSVRILEDNKPFSPLFCLDMTHK